MAKYTMPYGDLTVVECDSAKDALEFLELVNGYSDESCQVKLEKAIEGEHAAKKLAEARKQELANTMAELKQTREYLDVANYKVKTLEKKLAKIESAQTADKAMPAGGSGQKWPHYREKIKAYIEQNGPQKVSVLARECGVPSGSISGGVLKHEWFEELDGQLWTVKGLNGKQPKQPVAPVQPPPDAPLPDRVFEFLKTNGPQKSAFIAAAIASDIDTVVAVLKAEPEMFDRNPKDQTWFAVV